MTIVPLDDGVLGLPRLTGICLASWSFTYTLICLVALSTFMTTFWPTVTVAERSVSP